MRFLRIIRQDLLWLNSRLPALVKIIGVIIVGSLIVGGWYLGQEFWSAKAPVGRGSARLAPRWERWGVIALMFLLIYVATVVDRRRKDDE